MLSKEKITLPLTAFCFHLKNPFCYQLTTPFLKQFFYRAGQLVHLVLIFLNLVLHFLQLLTASIDSFFDVESVCDFVLSVAKRQNLVPDTTECPCVAPSFPVVI